MRRATMRTLISTAQKSCMFFFAALNGSLWVSGFVWSIFQADSPLNRLLTSAELPFVLAMGIWFLWLVVFWMVVGAWVGGLVSSVWESPAGKRVFSTLSGG